jgi:hypothetical protein
MDIPGVEWAVPAMTTDAQFGFTVSSSSQADANHCTVLAFDGRGERRWATKNNAVRNSWIQVQCPQPVVCNLLYIRARNDQWFPQAPTKFHVCGSQDGTCWTVLATVMAEWTQGQVRVIPFQNTVPYLYYRLLAKSSNSTSVALAQLNFGHPKRFFP